MADERPIIPTRFQLSWLLGPLAILLVAIAFVFLIPDAPPAPTNPGIIEQPALVEKNVDVNAAREQAKLQCSQTYTCTQVDCLEKVLVHVERVGAGPRVEGRDGVDAVGPDVRDEVRPDGVRDERRLYAVEGAQPIRREEDRAVRRLDE